MSLKDPNAMSTEELRAELDSHEVYSMSNEDLRAELDGKPASQSQLAVAPQWEQGGTGSAADMSSIINQKPVISPQTAAQYLPQAGAVAGGVIGATAGSVVPGAGTATGEVVGSGVGAAAGSVAKDALNNFMWGGSKSVGNIAKDAAVEGGEAAGAQLIGGQVLKLGSKAVAKVAESVVPTSVIARYQQAADAVNSLIRSSSGQVAEAADLAKGQMQTWIKNFRSTANEQINSALGQSTSRIDGSEVLDTLRKAASRLDGDTQKTELSQIDAAISMVRSKFDENGQIFVKDANSLKQWLQDQATAAYKLKANDPAAMAAKQAAAVTRRSMNSALQDEGLPGLAEANNRLSALHSIEDNMNRGLLQTGSAESSLVAAGKGAEGSPRNERALKLLGELTGQDFLGKAQDVAAVKAFSGAQSLKKGAIGMAAGSAVGGGIGYEAGGSKGAYVGAGIGATLGGALTSPAAVKFGMDAARNMPSQVAPITAQTLGQAVMHGTGAADSLKQIGGSP